MGEHLKNRAKGLVWLESFILAAILLGIIYIKYGVHFETNDDRMINEFFTGVLTGTHDGHAVFVSYWLGSLLAFLYSVAGQIPWYGGFMILSHFVVYWSFFGLLLEKAKTVYQHLLAIACGSFLVLYNMYIFGEIQFTSTASVLAVGGYLWLLLDERKHRRYIFFFLFELFSLFLRYHSMLMMQMMGGVLFGVSLLVKLLRKERTFKELFREGLKVLAVLAACFVVAWSGDYIVGDYGSEEWRAYNYYRIVKDDVEDFYGYPEYSQVADILAKYDISEKEYVGFTRYWVLKNEMDIECLLELREVAKENFETYRSGLSQYFIYMVKSRFEGGNMGYGKYSLMLYAFVVMMALLKKEWSYLLGVAGLNISRNIIWLYLEYNGRSPLRVFSGLYFMELVFLAAWLFILCRELGREKWWIKLAAAVVALMVTVISVDEIKDIHNGLNWMKDGRNSFSPGMDEIISYCQNSDKGYILVEMATTYYTGEALNTSWYQDRNYLSSGFWWSGCPNVTAYQEEYLAAHQGNLRLIEMAQGMDVGESFVVELFTQDWGLELNFVEELHLSNGAVLNVYDIIQ